MSLLTRRQIKNLDTLSPKGRCGHPYLKYTHTIVTSFLSRTHTRTPSPSLIPVRDTVFELIGVRADPDNAEEAERRANIEHTIFSPEFKRIMLKVGVSAQNPSRNNGEEAMRVEMPARSPRNSVSVGDGRQAVPMLTSVEGKGLLRGGAAGTTAEGGVRRRRETIAGGQVRFDGSTTYPQRSSAATFAESHRSGVHITSSNVIAEEPAAGTRVSENGGAQRRASLLPPVSEKPSVSRRGSNVLSPDTTSKQGRRRKSSVGHGGQQEAPLSEAQISAMRFAEILKQPDRYTQFINNGTATMPAIGPAITATPTAKELPVQQQGVTQLEDAADEYAEEWNESPIRNLAIELGQYIADMGNAQDNADAARKKQQEAAVNASTASIATTATTTTTSEEVTFEPLFRECRPVFALRAKTVAKLKANLRVNDERDPPDEHLDYLRTNANLPLTEYAGKKLLKEQRRRRRIEALREHYAEYERRLTMADRAHLLYKRIESVELQSMILNAKSEGLRNAMRAPVKANRGPRAASAGVTNEKLATTRSR